MLRRDHELTRKRRVRGFKFSLNGLFLILSISLLLGPVPPIMVEARPSAPRGTLKNDHETQGRGVQPDTSSKLAADPVVLSGPPDSVVALYFHRTLRCETCLFMEYHISQVIQHDYLAPLLDGSLRWRTLDYERPQHAGNVDKYQLEGPTLVLSHWKEGREISWAKVEEIWDFIDYPEAAEDTLRGRLDRCLAGTCRHDELSMPDSSSVRAPGDTTKG
ncbi:MAG: hypothetical protein JSW03_00560 [Candidatus Eiseniibacteriota bacterium]|nr:MAG: hypothetical protein JSW03_00560 [Candidatus Eisenbacteria bacterium]